MELFLFLEIVLLMLVAYASIYSIVDRICKCKENCSLSNSFSEFIKDNEKFKEKNRWVRIIEILKDILTEQLVLL